MTRKSRPTRQLIRTFNTPHQISMWVIPILAIVSGCSTFSAREGFVADYEKARQEIDDPDGYYRPEGKSAETDFRSVGFIDRFNLRGKRRKDREVARTHYSSADELFEAAKSLEGEERINKFRDSAEQYKLAAENWQSSGLEQDALLMAAEAHFFAEDYYRAEEFYERLVKEYPKNPYLDHVDSRRFEIADFWLQYDDAKPSPFFVVNFTDYKRPWNDTGGHGKRIIENIRLENPTGKIGDDATMRLAMDAYNKQDFEAAADTFADLRLTYPDSEHLFNAQLLELESLLKSYQGPAYSSIPIRDAQKRLDQITKQFPNEAREHENSLREAYAKLRYSMAERIWYQARFRRKKAENGAAKFHYNRILSEYSDTPFAEQAREELEKLKDAPDVPPQRFKALVWALGGSTDDRPWREKMNVGQQ